MMHFSALIPRVALEFFVLRARRLSGNLLSACSLDATPSLSVEWRGSAQVIAGDYCPVAFEQARCDTAPAVSRVR